MPQEAAAAADYTQGHLDAVVAVPLSPEVAHTVRRWHSTKAQVRTDQEAGEEAEIAVEEADLVHRLYEAGQ